MADEVEDLDLEETTDEQDERTDAADEADDARVADAAAVDPDEDEDEAPVEKTEKPKNMWQAAREEISKISESSSRKRVPVDGADDDDDAAKDESVAEDKAKAKADADKSAEGDEDEKEEKPAKRSWAIIDADGDSIDAQLPEGAVIKFKADGKDVEAKSLDELISLAQKGVHMDKRSTEFGQRERQYRTALSTRESRIKELVEHTEEMDEILLKAVFGDRDTRRALRQELAKYRDPEVRKALGASAKLEERETLDKEQEQSSRSESIKQFWSRAREEVLAAAPEYEFLDANDPADVRDILTEYYRGYQAERVRCLDAVRASAREQGLSDADVQAMAEQNALAFLTEANLHAAMARLNSRIEKRTQGRGGNAAGADAKKKPTDDRSTEERDRRDAKKHNDHVDTKLRQRTRPRLLRSGGTPERVVKEEPAQPKTFAGRMEAMRRELRKAAK